MNVRGGKGTIRWSPHTLPRLSNARGGGGKICRPLGAIPHLSNSGGHFVPPQYNNPLLWNVRGEGDCISLHRRRVVALSLSSSSSRRVVASRERSIVVLTQQILPATHLIANSGDDTARSTICVMPSRRQNRRLEKTARLIVATSARRRGCVEMGADGNGDRRQSLVRLFFLFFFRSSSFEFPARIKIRGGERPTGPPNPPVVAVVHI